MVVLCPHNGVETTSIIGYDGEVRHKGSEFMAKYTIQMNDRLDELLDQLANREGVSKAQVIRKSLTLLKFAEDQRDDGYRLTLVKEGEPAREILLT
jgi:predicted transcriptional regulator